MRSITLRKAKQKGFTLLELLVVITLLAILATGALLAYEGLTDTAQGAAASNNTATADQSIRNYRAVTGRYPNQWDHLVTDSGDGATGGAALDFVSPLTYRFLAGVTGIPTGANSAGLALQNAFLRVGVDEIQVRTQSGLNAGVEPNLQHNEGAVVLAEGTLPVQSAVELELGDNGLPEDFFNTLVIVPSAVDVGGTLTTCSVAGQAPARIGTDPLANITVGAAQVSNFLNKVNDTFEPGECNLVVALGFGNDAASSTSGSSVAIAKAPTYASSNINPATTYARYIALFHMGRGAEGVANITAADIFRKPQLVAVVDPEGKVIDQNIAVANTSAQQ